MDHFEKRHRDYLALTQPEQIKATPISTTPLINENASMSAIWAGMNTGGGLAQTSNSPLDYKSLWNIFMASPEAIAPCDTIVTDIISDGYKIKPIKDGDETAIKKATAFLESNQFKTHILPSQILDELVTGDAYVYTVRSNPDKYKEAIKAIARRLPLKNSKSREYLYYSLMDEDEFSAKKLINIASSTVKIFHDQHGSVLKYQQVIGVNKAEFTPKELIHWKYRNINGKVYGFCPMKSIIGELSLLAAIKDSAGNAFENGGTPMHMFNLPEEVPNSPNVKFLQEQLKDLKANMLEHRNLITTGKVEVDAFENITATMQYRELMEQMTRIIYTVWGVPPAKMGQSGGDKGGAYDSGLATEGYYRRISHLQDNIFSEYNAQLMIPEFKVQLIPNKAYLQDEMKETQMTKQKFDIAQQAWSNNWVTKEWIIEMLNIPKEMVGTFEKEQMQSNFRQGDLKNKTVNDETPKTEINKMKSETQKAKSPQVKALLEKGYTPREVESILFNDKLENGNT